MLVWHKHLSYPLAFPSTHIVQSANLQELLLDHWVNHKQLYEETAFVISQIASEKFLDFLKKLPELPKTAGSGNLLDRI